MFVNITFNQTFFEGINKHLVIWFKNSTAARELVGLAVLETPSHPHVVTSCGRVQPAIAAQPFTLIFSLAFDASLHTFVTAHGDK